MVSPSAAGDDELGYYDEVEESWPTERPSRKRAKRVYRRKQAKRVVVRAERLDAPDTSRVSRALLRAQRELARVQAESDAHQQKPYRTQDEQ